MEEQISQFVADQRDQVKLDSYCDGQMSNFNEGPVEGDAYNGNQTERVPYGEGQREDNGYPGGQRDREAPFNAGQSDMYADGLRERDSCNDNQMDREPYSDGKRERGSFNDGPRDRDRDRRRGDRDRDRRRDRRRRDRDRNRDRHWDRSQRDRSRDRGDDLGEGGRYSDRYNDNGHYNDASGYCDQEETSKGSWSAERDGNHSDDSSHPSYSRSRSIPHRGGEKWITDTPSQTILLKGLPQHVDEKDIRAELMMFGAPIKEVRLMKRKDNGVSRGFAFVEFQDIADAQRWKEQNQSQLLLLNQYTVSMYYSTPRSAVEMPEMWTRMDWSCAKNRKSTKIMTDLIKLEQTRATL